LNFAKSNSTVKNWNCRDYGVAENLLRFFEPAGLTVIFFCSGAYRTRQIGWDLKKGRMAKVKQARHGAVTFFIYVTSELD
jgi:hypothetical protein